jgi:membrane fusion protein (multidrug efflux system)
MIAKSEVENANNKYRRLLELNKTGVLQQTTVDDAKATYEAKKGSVARMDATLAKAEVKVSLAEVGLMKSTELQMKTQLRAAFDGVVTERRLRDGREVSSGEILMRIERIEKMRAVIQVASDAALLTKPGLPVDVSYDDFTNANPITATVSRIGYAFDANQTMKVEIDIPNAKEEIRPGMNGKTTIHLRARANSVRVPVSCLNSRHLFGPGDPGKVGLPFGRQFGVYIVREGKAYWSEVKTGVRTENEVEILTGLKATDTILLDARQLGKDEVPLKIDDKNEGK